MFAQEWQCNLYMSNQIVHLKKYGIKENFVCHWLGTNLESALHVISLSLWQLLSVW